MNKTLLIPFIITMILNTIGTVIAFIATQHIILTIMYGILSYTVIGIIVYYLRQNSALQNFSTVSKN